MYRTEGVLALLVLYVGLAHCFSWDVVVPGQKQLDFYDNNGTRTHTEEITQRDRTTSLAYDPVHNRVLFADGTSICSINISTRKIMYLVTGEKYAHVQIAYDPPTELLFWTETGSNSRNSIFSKPGYYTNAVEQSLLIKLDEDETVWCITVDSCGGYIYWGTNSKIERARFDGSERQVVLHKKVYERGGIAIDHQAQKMYWLDNLYVIDAMQMSIESADLNGENRRTLYIEQDDNMAHGLLVSKDFIYWRRYTSFSKLTKNSPHDEGEPKIISLAQSSYPLGMAYNYKIEDQTQIIENCESNADTNDFASLNVSTDESLLCVHGTKVSEESLCECTQGYIGERCEVSVCYNYCFQGACSVSGEGQPKCRCNASYSGERCEVNACQDYCLNNGVCSLNEESEPVCQCTGGYEGARCDVPVFLVKCLQTVSLLRDILNTDLTPVTLGKGVQSTCAPTAV